MPSIYLTNIVNKAFVKIFLLSTCVMLRRNVEVWIPYTPAVDALIREHSGSIGDVYDIRRVINPMESQLYAATAAVNSILLEIPGNLQHISYFSSL